MDGDRKQAIVTAIGVFGQGYSMAHRFEELAKLLEGLPAKDIAWALSYAGTMHNIHQPSVMALIDAQLQIQLVREHVAAQEKMSAAADKLQGASLALAIAAGVVGVAGLVIGVAQILVAVKGAH